MPPLLRCVHHCPHCVLCCQALRLGVSGFGAGLSIGKALIEEQACLLNGLLSYTSGLLGSPCECVHVCVWWCWCGWGCAVGREGCWFRCASGLLSCPSGLLDPPCECVCPAVTARVLHALGVWRDTLSCCREGRGCCCVGSCLHQSIVCKAGLLLLAAAAG